MTTDPVPARYSLVPHLLTPGVIHATISLSVSEDERFARTIPKGRRLIRTVKELLQRKGYEIHAISPNATVFDALTLMAAKNVGALLVLDGQTLVGVISERDYARKVILHGKSSKETPVREIMTSRVVHVSPDTPVEACMALMTDKHVRHLPVMDDGALIGVISIGDVVNAIISNQQFAIDQLKTFHEYDPRDR